MEQCQGRATRARKMRGVGTISKRRFISICRTSPVEGWKGNHSPAERERIRYGEVREGRDRVGWKKDKRIGSP